MLVVFLPALLFESACFGIDMGLFRKQVLQICMLAFPAMIVASVVTGLLVWSCFTHWSFWVCWLIGIILSATDPVAVVALLKDLARGYDVLPAIGPERISAVPQWWQLFFRMHEPREHEPLGRPERPQRVDATASVVLEAGDAAAPAAREPRPRRQRARARALSVFCARWTVRLLLLALAGYDGYMPLDAWGAGARADFLKKMNSEVQATTVGQRLLGWADAARTRAAAGESKASTLAVEQAGANGAGSKAQGDDREDE